VVYKCISNPIDKRKLCSATVLSALLFGTSAPSVRGDLHKDVVDGNVDELDEVAGGVSR
jgi:hypothetical protein